ncbi:MAG TPA: glycosyltransferase [Polyangium sp.]|nr:glycosyltransferase [Polyangium sp.]
MQNAKHDTNALLTLSMIVKNEAATLARTLRSVKPFIDRWVIVDTGSTDATREVIREEMAGVPGELHEKPFVDFSTTRNEALDLAGTATEFVLWLDADDELDNGKALRTFLARERNAQGPDREVYYVRINIGFAFDSARILRTRAGWRFRGVVHEVLTHPDRPPPTHRIPEVVIQHHPPPDALERSKKRWERDIGLLEKALADDPTDSRAAFYLANTFYWLQRYDEAEKAYIKRISLGGWYEELYESRFTLAKIAAAKHRSWLEVQSKYLDAHLTSPHRAEPLFAIAAHHDALKQHALTFLYARRGYELPYPKQDKLFIDEEVYTWKLADLVASSAYWIGEFAIGEEAARKAARARPQDKRLQSNLEFYLQRKTKKK